VVNRRPGAVDRQLLPIESLAAGLTLGESELRLADLDVRLSGGGRLQGSGSLRDDRTGAARRGEPRSTRVRCMAACAARNSPARCAPRSACIASSSRPTCATAVRDRQGKLLHRSGRGHCRDAAAGRRRRATAGQWQGRAGRWRASFALRGSLSNFDPSRFARLPAARLNAEFEAQGSSRPQLALGLRFQLRDSRLGKRVAGGQRRDRPGRAAAAQGRRRTDCGR
jgi:translocation and assembly module TamB